MSAKSLAIFGSASDVGKSVVVTALCRIFSNMGIKTAPFKAQNMSNNSFVTNNFGEIGRAQAVQAFACNITPTEDMNPVLLKPSGDKTAQVILHGKAIGNREASDYFKDTDFMFKESLKSLEKIKNEFDLIIIEGAGSCAEVNLRKQDFVNFKTAKAANANVILVADIDKGGVFAQIIGTLECLDKQERRMIKGFIINKFRGDIGLFEDGIDYIQQRTGIPVLGVIPYFYDIEIEYEDGLPLNIEKSGMCVDKNMINIAVLKLPHISNFTDFLPFNLEEQVRIHYLSKPKDLLGYDALIIPGSKNVVYDLQWIKSLKWDEYIKNYEKSGGFIFGICGGYQMLSREILDPFFVESNIKKTMGLGLLDIVTRLEKNKTLTNTKAVWIDNNVEVEGYEIHMGKTVQSNEKPALRTDRGSCEEYGAVRGRTAGCYLHGIFDKKEFRHYFLSSVAKNKFTKPNPLDYDEFRQMQYELLADRFKTYVDVEKIMQIIGKLK